MSTALQGLHGLFYGKLYLHLTLQHACAKFFPTQNYA
jgi:hypothetical protein